MFTPGLKKKGSSYLKLWKIMKSQTSTGVINLNSSFAFSVCRRLWANEGWQLQEEGGGGWSGGAGGHPGHCRPRGLCRHSGQLLQERRGFSLRIFHHRTRVFSSDGRFQVVIWNFELYICWWFILFTPHFGKAIWFCELYEAWDVVNIVGCWELIVNNSSCLCLRCGCMLNRWKIGGIT